MANAGTLHRDLGTCQPFDAEPRRAKQTALSTPEPCARPFALIVGRADEHLPPEILLREGMTMRFVLPEAVGAFRRQIDALFAPEVDTAPRGWETTSDHAPVWIDLAL